MTPVATSILLKALFSFSRILPVNNLDSSIQERRMGYMYDSSVPFDVPEIFKDNWENDVTPAPNGFPKLPTWFAQTTADQIRNFNSARSPKEENFFQYTDIPTDNLDEWYFICATYNPGIDEVGSVYTEQIPEYWTNQWFRDIFQEQDFYHRTDQPSNPEITTILYPPFNWEDLSVEGFYPSSDFYPNTDLEAGESAYFLGNAMHLEELVEEDGATTFLQDDAEAKWGVGGVEGVPGSDLPLVDMLNGTTTLFSEDFLDNFTFRNAESEYFITMDFSSMHSLDSVEGTAYKELNGIPSLFSSEFTENLNLESEGSYESLLTYIWDDSIAEVEYEYTLGSQAYLRIGDEIIEILYGAQIFDAIEIEQAIYARWLNWSTNGSQGNEPEYPYHYVQAGSEPIPYNDVENYFYDNMIPIITTGVIAPLYHFTAPYFGESDDSEALLEFANECATSDNIIVWRVLRGRLGTTAVAHHPGEPMGFYVNPSWSDERYTVGWYWALDVQTQMGYYTHNSGYGNRSKVEIMSRSDLLRARGYKV